MTVEPPAGLPADVPVVVSGRLGRYLVTAWDVAALEELGFSQEEFARDPFWGFLPHGVHFVSLSGPGMERAAVGVDEEVLRNLLLLPTGAGGTNVEPRSPLDVVLGALRSRLAARLGEWSRLDRDVLAEYEPEQLARALVDGLLPAPSDWTDIGPLLRAQTVLERMAWTQEELAAAVQGRRVLRVTTTDHIDVYPQWQFDDPRIAETIEAVWGEHVDGWTVAAWFSHPNDDLGGLSPLSAVASGQLKNLARAAADARRRFDQ